MKLPILLTVLSLAAWPTLGRAEIDPSAIQTGEPVPHDAAFFAPHDDDSPSDADLRWLTGRSQPWMKEGKMPSKEDFERIHQIYQEGGERKLFALDLMIAMENIDVWGPEIDKLIESREDDYFLRTMLGFKFRGGSERERIILANKPGLPEWIESYANDPKHQALDLSDLTMIREQVAKYRGRPDPTTGRTAMVSTGADHPASGAASPAPGVAAIATNTAEDDKASEKVGQIVGAVVGVVLILVLRAVYIRKKSNRSA